MTPIVEGSGEHADDFVRFAVHTNGAADDVDVATETLLPATLADNNDAIVARSIFPRPEIPAELWLNAKQGKEISGIARGFSHLGRLAGFREAGVRQGVG